MSTQIPAVRRAIRIAGSQEKLARQLRERTGWSLGQKAVAKWLKVGRVPLQWLIHIEAVTGVTCHELDPEYYPRHAA